MPVGMAEHPRFNLRFGKSGMRTGEHPDISPGPWTSPEGPGMGTVPTVSCGYHKVLRTKPQEKGFKLKEYSRLKSHESLSESDSKTGHHVREGLAAYRRGRLGITLPAHYNWL
jgi:hypothetical protein